MKYFILPGFVPEVMKGAPSFGGRLLRERAARIDRWLTTGFDLPREGEHPYLRLDGVGRLAVFIHDVYDTCILVSSRSQEKAYSIASPFRSYAAVFLGLHSIDMGGEQLLELTQKPNPKQSSDEIAKLYRQIWRYRVDPSDIALTLGSGSGIFLDQIELACEFIAAAYPSRHFVLSLLHLERSHYLFSGFMTSSYYYFHYSRDRVAETQYARRKKYLEERTRFDLAFLSAFRAIEALLGVPSLKKHDIRRRLAALDKRRGTSFSQEKWQSFHEVFTSGRKYWSYPEIIEHYLDIRNSVAAHSNPKPPFRLEEDQVFEIQSLTANMLYETVMGPDSKDA